MFMVDRQSCWKVISPTSSLAENPKESILGFENSDFGVKILDFLKS